MKQIEMLDVVLKALYEKSVKDGKVVRLLKEKGVEINLDDAHRLGRRLADAGYVKFASSRDSAWISMKSEGIEFVEGDSFTHKGQSAITNNYTISNSSNANIISQSNQVTINQAHTDQTKHILMQIRDVINLDSTVDEAKRKDVIECTQEIEDSISNGKVPKFAIKSLLEILSNIASVASLALQLAGLLPQ